MDASNPYRDFFLKPSTPRQRRYEVLRARFVHGSTIRKIAQQFGLSPATVQTQIRDFKRAFDRGQPERFFLQPKLGPQRDRKKPLARDHILRLRARGYADTDIHHALSRAGIVASVALIDQVLREEGLIGLRKRTRQERQRVKEEIRSGKIPGLTFLPASPDIPAVANVRLLDLGHKRTLYTRVAGVFLFLPFLTKIGLDKIVATAEMVGTKMIPPISYVLSLLALKLLDKERKSHISDWNFDEALGLFAGLNVLPKTTAASDYSSRLIQGQHNRLLAEWVRAAYPVLCPQSAREFALDYHAIPHRGVDTGLENHYVPLRGKAVPSVLTCFARAVDSPMLCYGQGDIVREEQANLPHRFVAYWEGITGMKPDWLYFDSRTTTYAGLDQLHQWGVHFITIRRRGCRVVERLLARPASAWTSAVIDTPRRRHQRVRFLDEPVKLKKYSGPCRQVAVTGLGRATPTLFLTDNEVIPGREVITRYIRRNAIENDLGINVNFFHLDCLASEVRLNVNLDVVMTVLANGCYRWLSQRLKGCQRMGPKQLYRKYVETGGHVEIKPRELVVQLDRRSHNPVIAAAELDRSGRRIPWLRGKRLRLSFR
jgi:transposase